MKKYIELITPLFLDGLLSTSRTFYSLFAKQYFLIKSNSKPPGHIQYLTDHLVSSVSLSQDYIVKIIQNVNGN